MGCDFYTYYRVCVELTNKRVKRYVLEDTRERHYWTEFVEPVEYDEDFEPDEEYYKRVEENRKLSQECNDRQIERELASYTTKDLYKDNKWLCVESSVKKYRDILTYLKVSEKDVVRIWKEGGAELR
jgi:hypothetical protein